IEKKNVEFDYADYGTLGLESAFGALNTLFTTKKAIDVFTSGNAVFGIENQSINPGNNASSTLFNPTQQYTFTTTHIHSKSKNAIFLNETLKGIAYGIFANNKLHIS